ncbi:helix-turn-helix domain-containing protein [Clostridium sp. MCC353]|uniref:helix-turn-helix domain-containing protein n=1 Tax=Clostridium sp. MCC353 TaxID=2592646 RepID=UPI001C016C8F|nr:helix-turn-helix transcriptional regulator [Clostridium sp. MCC353]MBT9777941.1 helix-turn-helix domain-containing protein [Clostridium sp. MCC353]
MNITFFKQKTPTETARSLAARIRDIRKRKKMSQIKLSEKSGVSLGSVKRFEQSGEISLLSLIKIAIALDISDQLETLFEDIPPMSIEEIIREND